MSTLSLTALAGVLFCMVVLPGAGPSCSAGPVRPIARRDWESAGRGPLRRVPYDRPDYAEFRVYA